MVKGYNIVIIPNQAVADTARKVSAKISTIAPTCFQLDSALHNPHITIYHISLDTDSLEEVHEKLRRIASSRDSFSLNQKQYRLIDTRWIDIGYESDENIMKLHRDVLEAVSPLRVQDVTAEMREEWSDMSPERQENLELYGWSEIRNLYRPHLTLTRLVESAEEEILGKLPEGAFSFEVDTIALYELGEYGTCTAIIAEYKLQEEKI